MTLLWYRYIVFDLAAIVVYFSWCVLWFFFIELSERKSLDECRWKKELQFFSTSYSIKSNFDLLLIEVKPNKLTHKPSLLCFHASVFVFALSKNENEPSGIHYLRNT